MSKPNAAPMSQTPVPGAVLKLLEGVRARAEKAGVFGAITVDSAKSRVCCRAANSAEPAEYRVDVQEGKLWVSMVTANRWLSQSIEADLMHTGDKIPELLDEELVDQGYDVKGAASKGLRTTFEHFRSDDKLFTFRSPLPIMIAQADAPASIDAASQWLLAYEACFRRLGDMDAGSGEDE
jgi:hypothetical protein